MLGEDIGPLRAAHIPQHAAAHAGEHPHEQHQEPVRPVPRLDSDGGAVGGEDAQTQRVRQQQHCLRISVVQLRFPAAPHEKHQYGHCDGYQRLHGVPQGRRRRQPQHRIPQHTAAHRRGHAQHGHAEQIHLLADTQRRAGDGEGRRADQLEIKLERLSFPPATIHHPPRCGKRRVVLPSLPCIHMKRFASILHAAVPFPQA